MKLNYYLTALSIAALTSISCQNDQDGLDGSGVYDPTSRLYAFTASINNSTRVTLASDGLVSWKSGDMLEVYDRAEGDASFRSNYTFKLITSEFEDYLAEFEGIAVDVAAQKREIFAVYPFYDVDADGSHDNIYINSEDKLRLTLPETQDQGYDQYLYMMSEVSNLDTALEDMDGFEFAMQPLVSTLRVNIGGFDTSTIESVTMSVVGASSDEGFITRMLYNLGDGSSEVYASASLITVSGDGKIVSTIDGSPCVAFSIFPTDLTGQTIRFSIYFEGIDNPITVDMVGENFEANMLYTTSYIDVISLELNQTDSLADQLEANGHTNLTSITNLVLTGGYLTYDDIYVTLKAMSNLMSLDISGCSSINYIPAWTFQYFSNLETIVLPSSIQSLEAGVFRGCEKLQNINLENITTMANKVFQYCSSLQEIELPALSSITLSCFEGCALSSVTIKESSTPETAITLNNLAFALCENLTTVTFEAALAPSVSSYSDETSAPFYGSPVEKIIVPAASLSSYKAALADYADLIVGSDGSTETPDDSQDDSQDDPDPDTEPDTVSSDLVLALNTSDTLADQLTAAGYTDLSIIETVTLTGGSLTKNDLGTIATMTNATTIDISGCSSSVDNAYSSWLVGNTTIKIVKLPSTILKLSASAFSGCSSLSQVVLSSATTYIYGSVFLNCTSLESIELPSSLQSIGASAFNGSGLTSVTVSGTPTLNNLAFASCENLTTVTFESTTVPTISAYTDETSAPFYNSPVTKIIVPAESLEDYKTALADYADLIEAAE